MIYRSNAVPIKISVGGHCYRDGKADPKIHMELQRTPIGKTVLKKNREFPGGPVVRAPRFHCRGYPVQVTKILQALQCGKERKKERGKQRERERERERGREGERERLGLIVKSFVFQIQGKTKTNKQNPIFFFYF